MIKCMMDNEHAILTVCPTGPLSESDFRQAGAIADPVIAERGSLDGLIIHADKFPGWQGFSDMLSHFRFVKAHHRHIAKVAVVSDDALLKFFPHISAHFVSAEIRQFPYAEYDAAKAWIVNKQNRP